MAEFSGFWTTNAAGSGHQVASYTQAHWSDAADIMGSVRSKNGVAAGYLNSLAGTVTGANAVSINTGGAMVDGKWFKNDAAKSVNIPSAVGGGNTRIDRIVLRTTWSGFKVEITRIAGTDAASPSVPALTQTSGTTYDIPLYRALVNTSGAVTLTDERQFGQVPTNGIADGAVTTVKIADNAITTAKIADSQIGASHLVNGAVNVNKLGDGAVTVTKLADNAVETAKIKNANVTLAKMAANSVDSDQYVDGSIDTVHMANDAVDDTKVGDRVLQFYRRQGGNASNWSFGGATNYTPGAVRMQAGSISFDGDGKFKDVTMPVAFSDYPLPFCSQTVGSLGNNYYALINVVPDGTFQKLRIFLDRDPGVEFIEVRWLAIGPE